MRTFLLAAGIAAGLLSTPAATQADPAKPVVATAPVDAATARRQDLVRRYFKAVDFEHMMNSMMSVLIPNMINQMRASRTDVTNDQVKIISDAVTESFAEFTPKYMDALVDVYADAFTEDELTKMDEFYESPEGQSIVHKMPAMTPKTMDIMNQMIPDIIVEVKAKMCAKMTCPKSGEPGA